MGAATPVNLAKMIASLSLATDSGCGLPKEHVLRQTVIGSRLAELADLGPEEQAATFYISLLARVGCIADSHELAHWFGDDRQIRGDSYQVDKVGLPMMRMMLSHVGAGAGPVRRMTILGRFLGGGFRDTRPTGSSPTVRPLGTSRSASASTTASAGASPRPSSAGTAEAYPGPIAGTRSNERCGSCRLPMTPRSSAGSAVSRRPWRCC